MGNNLKENERCVKCPLYKCPAMRQFASLGIDIMFVGAYPVGIETEKGAFTSAKGLALRNVIKEIQARRPSNEQLKIDYTYACLCKPDFDGELGKYKIDTEIICNCAMFLKQRIDRFKPKVIVALGVDSVKALDFKMQFRDMRGGIYNFKCSDGTQIPVVVTFHVANVAKSPGLIKTFQIDILKAFMLASDNINDVDMNLSTPVEASDVCEMLREAYRFIDSHYEATGKLCALAVDTETTSLVPYNPDDRVIAVSLSWEANQGVAYPWRHKKNLYSEAEFAEIYDLTKKLLSHPHAYIVMANGKFDLQWLMHHYGIPINMRYDVILAEHILDENKKGQYSLKKMTRDYFPSMGKYEEELKNHLEAKWKEKEEAAEKIRASWLEKTNDAIIAWWCSLRDNSRRLEYLVDWESKGYVQLSDIRDIDKIKTRKLKGELVIPKKYQQAVTNLIHNIPKHEFPAGIFTPAPEIPAELGEHNYEDADIDILLKYAAIDALTTRLICYAQRRGFEDDNVLLLNTRKAINKEIPTRPCWLVMEDNTIPLCKAIAHMEYNGVRIDRELAREYGEKISGLMKQTAEEMFNDVGRKFNTSSSSPDLGNILYNEMGLPVINRTQKGDPSTDAETLKELSDEYDLPFLNKLLVYRKLDKCLNTYINNWIEKSEMDGKLHAQFNQIGTATYRLSSSNPWLFKSWGCKTA